MIDFAEKTVKELRECAKKLNLPGVSKLKKDELVSALTEVVLEGKEETLELNKKESQKRDAVGILDLHSDGYGFLRNDDFNSTEEDIYVSPTQIRRFRLKTGDFIHGVVREQREGEKFAPLIYLHSINDVSAENMRYRKDFDNLTPIFPLEKLSLEFPNCPISNRMMDLLSPIGKGQRGLIVAPPKTGKTTLLKSVAKAIERNNPETVLFVLLIDERPEEVTDMRRSIHSQVVASTFDEEPINHIRLSEFLLERAKRLVETGKDVVILLDSITRLTRAYNLSMPTSGKVLSGGIDPTSFYKPKRFFGAARKIEEGGSLTILATALIETGSRMDDVIFEEFKGTGNMEIHLSRELSDLRIFPAVDIFKSGTRKEELLLSQREYEVISTLRRKMQQEGNIKIGNDLIRSFKNTKDNQHLLDFLEKGLS
ncbi:transcription termination factor Rho [Peptostreptococcaceae bacterium oral taxon 113 str. W5053]|nr:transcription termination factor Rho [Peptostreptococcaceae bacterium oral taxon 113 str. W5053]